MTSNDHDQERCPNCGRFQADEPDGYFAFIAGNDFVSVFCDQRCCAAFEAKGGALLNPDGERSVDWRPGAVAAA